MGNKTTYIGSEFNLTYNRVQKSATVVLKPIGALELSTYILEKIINCILSIECGRRVIAAPNYATELQITFMQASSKSLEIWPDHLYIQSDISDNGHTEKGTTELEANFALYLWGCIGEVKYKIFERK